MKSIVVLLVFSILFLNAFCQSNKKYHFGLGVEKVYSDSIKTYVFKADKPLEIMTIGKISYTSDHYTFSDKFIVMDMKDTIPFNDISWIRGKVYDNIADKTLGIIIIAISAPIAAFGITDLIVEGDPGGAIVGLLFAGATYYGIRLVGAKKFKISSNCHVKVIQQEN
jgi:hypothetical protein